MEASPRNKGNGIVANVISTAIGLAATVALAFSGYVVSAQSGLAGEIRDVRATAAAQGERISTQEATVKSVDDRLGRIETKIDRLIENYQKPLGTR